MLTTIRIGAKTTVESDEPLTKKELRRHRRFLMKQLRRTNRAAWLEMP